MCFIGLIGKEQPPCCISTIFLSSTGPGWLAGWLARRHCLPLKGPASLHGSFCLRHGREAVSFLVFENVFFLPVSEKK